MYHTIVRRIACASFESLSKGDYEALLSQCSSNVEHRFAGNHALGGTRHSVQAMRRWFQRLFVLFPGLNFEIKEILVRGWPWNTRVAVEWIDRATTSDGVPYINEGVHLLHIRWGRLTKLHAYLDTQKVEEVCKRLAQQGIAEASASPIED